ncbi:4Fe-4S dicluster domain-containing protein [candidate division KSB1 bacterium]|nr:4Fe-4S dicluster domain-containing protein [candidate division KSB1 bacterium]
MGHIQNAKSSLVPLIDRLNQYPVGLVDNDILREILSILFSEQEAFVASRFPLIEATLDEISNLTIIPETELLPILDSMADKGLIMDMPYGDTTYYLLMPGLIGFIEFTFMKRRSDIPMKQLAKLLEAYFNSDIKNGQYKEFFGSKTQLTRSLVFDDAIPVTSVITDYESARKIVEHADFSAVSTCHCRHVKEHEGIACKKGAPVDGICISLGTGARFLARRGFAEAKTTAELLDVIELARSLRLTHITDNIRHRPTFICNCCGCCCGILAGVQAGYFDGVAKSSYIAVIDPDMCDYCGACFTACNVKAIRPAKSNGKAMRKALVSEQVCLGCGACISACPNNAISMIPRSDYVIPPRTKKRMFVQMLWEKKRLWPFVREIAGKRIRKVIPWI